MKANEFLDKCRYRFDSRFKLLKKKGHDYATEDFISNFKRVGKAIEALQITKLPAPLAYGFMMIIMKIDRWVNLLLKNTEPKNESLEDTVGDLQNYIDLVDAVSKEL